MGRFSEPSTWAGVAALLEVVKVLLPEWAGVLVALQGAAGAYAVMLREKGGGV